MSNRKAYSLEDVRSIARSHTASMINVLVSIAQQPKAPEGARVSAAVAVLDRGWGKPDQQVSSKSEITVIVRKLMHEPMTIEHDPLTLPETLPETQEPDE